MDRDILLFEKMNEIYDKKISFMIESLDNQLKINMLEAQYIVVAESGTKEDFEYLYMEAKEETKEKKKNIFSQLIKQLENIVNSINKFFKNKKIDNEIKKLPENFEVDERYQKKISGFKKFHNWLVKPINLIKSKNFKDITKTLLDAGVTIVCTIMAVKTAEKAYNFVKTNKNKIKTDINWIRDVFIKDSENAKSGLVLYEDTVEMPETGVMALIKKLIECISKVISEAMKLISSLMSKSNRRNSHGDVIDITDYQNTSIQIIY